MNLGPSAAVIVAALVSVSCAGTINSQMFTGGRLIASAALRGYLPSALSHLDVCGFINGSCGDNSKDEHDSPASSSAERPSSPPAEQQPLLGDRMEPSTSLEAGTSPEASPLNNPQSEREVPASVPHLFTM